LGRPVRRRTGRASYPTACCAPLVPESRIWACHDLPRASLLGHIHPVRLAAVVRQFVIPALLHATFETFEAVERIVLAEALVRVVDFETDLRCAGSPHGGFGLWKQQ